MGVETHPKEIRQKIVTLTAADLTAIAYPGTKYVVSDRMKTLKESNTTALVQHYINKRTKKALNECEWAYEYHIYLGVSLMDPDQAQAAMDDFAFRTVKSLGSHPKLDAYVIDSKEEVFNCFVNECDENRFPKDAANNYLIISRIKFLVQTNVRGA